MTHRDFLFHLERFGIKLGLENITHLLEALGEPHLSFPCIHVAGTNGKGSVLAMVDAVLRNAGYTVGRYTSPHLIDVNERLLFNGVPISDDELDEQLGAVRAIAESMEPVPTFFEFLTAVAFRWFAEKNVDIALIEVGMGGRFDATNVVYPEVAAITNIDLEHTKYLGDTLGKIAFEKAGIIKTRVPVVVTERKPEPLEVILSRAEAMRSPAIVLRRQFDYVFHDRALNRLFEYHGVHVNLPPVRLGLGGAHQGDNAAAAAALCEILAGRFPNISISTMVKGLAEARWPCRLEKVLENPPVIIDVAHNTAGAVRLAEELGECVLLLGVSSDKAADQMIQVLAPKAREIVLTQFTGSRALPIDRLCEAAGTLRYHRAPQLADALDLGIRLASKDLPLIITGSVFLAGEARRLLIERYGALPLQF